MNTENSSWRIASTKEHCTLCEKPASSILIAGNFFGRKIIFHLCQFHEFLWTNGYLELPCKKKKLF